MTKLKALLARIRVRLGALALTLLVVLSATLDILGLIDLRPALTPIFGERTELALVIITVVLGIMKPLISLRPTPRENLTQLIAPETAKVTL